MIIAFSYKKPAIHLPVAEKRAIDLRIERLYETLQEEDSKNSCIEAKASARIIKENLNGLKKLEPYYQWREIRKVLLSIAANNC